MLRLLLPDADVVIGLYELGLWDKVIKSYKIYMAGTVLGEVTHYWRGQEKIEIDLSADVAAGRVIELHSSLEVQAEILKKLKASGLDGLDAGELESIAIIYKSEIDGLRFCVRERLAIKAVAYLGFKESTICVEEVLRSAQLISKTEVLPPIYSQKRFDAIILEGAFAQVSNVLAALKKIPIMA